MSDPSYPSVYTSKEVIVLNPFLIGSQRPGEDQITYALACTLQETGAAGLRSLLAALGHELRLPDGPVVAEVQTASITTRPDARLEVPGQVVVLVESKIVAESLRADQVVGHLDLFGATSGSVPRVLLALTPDAGPPGWWAGTERSHDAVRWVHGSWQHVFDWARVAALDEDTYGEGARLLLRGLVALLQGEKLGRRVEGKLDPERARRVERGTDAFMRDLIAQHDAQEVLLQRVADAFATRVAEGGLCATPPTVEVSSRWRDPRCWSWVSSYAQIDWSSCELAGWPVQKLWVEVFLDQGPEGGPGRLRLRSGLLVEGRVAYQTWYGNLLEASATAFAGRHGHWRRGSGYGEAWAYRDFHATDPDRMVAELVDDLVTWVRVVLPRLRAT